MQLYFDESVLIKDIHFKNKISVIDHETSKKIKRPS